MTVGELAKLLETVPDHFEVVFSIDPEGNAFRLVTEADPAHARDEGRGMRDVLHPDDQAEGDADNALVLWP